MKKYLFLSFFAVLIVSVFYFQQPNKLKKTENCFSSNLFGVEAAVYKPCKQKGENCTSPLKGSKPCCKKLTCKLAPGKKSGFKQCL